MNTDTKLVQTKGAAGCSLPVLRYMRQHPIMVYFFLAFIFTWGWQVPIFAITHQQLLGPWVIFAPSLAGFVMAGITEGRTGFTRLLGRFLIWRTSILWYGVALLLLPAIWIGSILTMPGAVAAFQMPGAAFLSTYLGAFAYQFMYAITIEEFGWRGFALPRLQESHGPLWGTLILGLFWGLWHLPGWAFFPNAVGAGTTLPAFGISFLLYVAMIAASAIFYTWITNHSRGSILLPTLMHASANTAGGTFPALFPALFPHPIIPVALELGMILTAAGVLLVTRMRLGYDSYSLFFYMVRQHG